MKSTLLIIVAILVFIPFVIRAQQNSPEDFIAAYRAAIETKDPAKIEALTYLVGMSDDDKKHFEAQLGTNFNDQTIDAITLEPLPLGYKPTVFFNGRAWEPTYPPVGTIQIRYKQVAPGKTTSSSDLYAIIDGNYFLIPNKSSDVPTKTYPLTTSGADSPDGKYRFVVIKGGNPGSEILFYGLTMVSANKVLFTIPCAYKIEAGNEEWTLQNAQAAQIYWNKDSSWFVLDEENYRFIGYAILGSISESKRSITTHEFLPGDLGMNGFDQWRIRVDKGWISTSTLSLEISGVSNSTTATPGAHVTQNFNCQVDDTNHYRFEKINK